ncbi:MAG TPA: hypothetical protein VEK83_12680 [Gemmatimonadales bacterium]|nr:hypothetical protein [Gemmatimonadales bacterium]
MSDRVRGWVFAVAAFSLVTNAAAQDAPALERRLQKLDVLRHDASDALVRAEKARIEPLDTLKAGSLVVVARPADAALVSQATIIAWAKLDTLYGDAVQHMAGVPLLFFKQGQPLRNVSPAVQQLQQVMGSKEATVADVAFQLVRAASAAIGQRADTALTNWLGPMLLPDATARVERSHVYVELVTAPAVAVRRCYAGVVESCATALGIVEGDRAPLWYDAPERRTVVRRNQESAQRLGLNPTIRACVEQESDAACLQVLHALPWIEPPLSNEARQSLARVALSLGGRRAFVRLSESSGRPLTQRLTIAAAVPLDSLIHQWRDFVIAARPRPVTLAPSFAWTALGWSVVFGLLALRSTRWR